MDIVVKSRHTEVSERFKEHVIEKLSKLTRLDGKVIALDVEVSKEHNPRLASKRDRIEITCRSRGPVIRAEASADDPYAALDLAYAKMEMRLRKVVDRRRVHHGRHAPMSVGKSTAALASPNGGRAAANPRAAAERDDVDFDSAAYDGAGRSGSTGSASQASGQSSESAAPAAPPLIQVDGEGPLVVREKVHQASPMTLDQALYEMELVGHDFYLFVDAETKLASVVYRRRGYDYGVIRLEV
ncbi:MAG: ribosome-associated translation inhibitor RaiA [Sporichthyaceae bacterium]|nr:ribosome-associated translation inhibitor RaiA [Sporichthyaceae bacterium]